MNLKLVLSFVVFALIFLVPSRAQLFFGLQAGLVIAAAFDLIEGRA